MIINTALAAYMITKTEDDYDDSDGEWNYEENFDDC